MARKRMIDPNIWQSEDFSKLSTLGKIVFIGLFSLADDEGRGRCNPVYLKSTLFPYEENIRSTDINKTLSEISSNMSVVFYIENGSSYYNLYNWHTWQKIDRPSQSKIPEYNEKTMQKIFDNNSTNNQRRVSYKIKENNKKEIEDKRNRIKNIYNTKCTQLPQIQKLTEKREKAIDKFLEDFTEEQFKKICQITNSTEFLIGKNEKGWKADFDFLIRIDKATNILEGKYGNTKQENTEKEAFLNE